MEQKEKKIPFRGIATALVTPFREDVPDLYTYRRLIELQLEAHVDALVVAGTTGEAPTLSEKERDTLLAEAIHTAKGRTPIVMGCGSADTAHALAYAKRAKELGADAILVVTPYYNKGTKEGLRRHFLYIAESVDVPLILYNVPSRTGVDLSLEDYAVLAEHPGIVGIKEASSSIEKMAWLTHTVGKRMAVYTGNDSMLLPSLALGADGVISVASGIVPRAISRIFHAFSEGNTKEALWENERLLPLFKMLFEETNPAPVKCALSLLGLGTGEMRLPMTPPSDTLAKALRAVLSTLDTER